MSYNESVAQIRKEYRGENNEILSIIISNPKKLNALTTEMQITLATMLREVKNDSSIRALVIRGEGDRAFSSGGELSCLEDLGSQQGSLDMYQRGDDIRSFIRSMIDKPVIAAVSGYCIGAGFEIAMCCDMIYASDDALFSLPEVELGLVPGWGGAIRLPRKITVNRAKEMIMLGEKISAQEAWRLCIVNKVFPKAELFSEVDGIVDQLVKKPPLAIKGIKTIVSNGIVDGNVEIAHEIEKKLSIDLMATHDFHESIAAIKEKRKPVFTGD